MCQIQLDIFCTIVPFRGPVNESVDEMRRLSNSTRKHPHPQALSWNAYQLQQVVRIRLDRSSADLLSVAFSRVLWPDVRLHWAMWQVIPLRRNSYLLISMIFRHVVCRVCRPFKNELALCLRSLPSFTLHPSICCNCSSANVIHVCSLGSCFLLEGTRLFRGFELRVYNTSSLRNEMHGAQDAGQPFVAWTGIKEDVCTRMSRNKYEKHMHSVC